MGGFTIEQFKERVGHLIGKLAPRIRVFLKKE